MEQNGDKMGAMNMRLKTVFRSCCLKTWT